VSLVNHILPPRLSPGDTVAAVTLSWGGPGTFPYRYEAGKRQFEETFGCRVIEAPHALKNAAFIQANPQARAEDLMWAFENSEVKAVISTIGGEDSIRMLPFIDFDKLRRNPKIFLGYSDSTVTHFMCQRAGLVSYYGPSFMSGFAENCGIHDYLKESVRTVLFEGGSGKLRSNQSGWTVEMLPWENPENQNTKRTLNPSTGWKVLQGGEPFEGRLLGGCINTLERIISTDLWPSLDCWKGTILFFETSESAPSPAFVRKWLKGYEAQGIFDVIQGVLFGRPGGHELTEEDYLEYDDMLQEIFQEAGCSRLPLISRMDFGHTDPMMVLPVGGQVRVSPAAQTLTLQSPF